jgi:transcriptional regulator with XRE-family HTH domain
MDTLAQRLRAARERAGLNQSELGRRVGVAPQSIQAIEAGKVRRTRALHEIADVLDVSADWLDPGADIVKHVADDRRHVVAEATFADSLSISIRANRPFDATVRHRLLALLELNGVLSGS